MKRKEACDRQKALALVAEPDDRQKKLIVAREAHGHRWLKWHGPL